VFGCTDGGLKMWLNKHENEFLYKLDRAKIKPINTESMIALLASMEIGDSFEVVSQKELNRVYECLKKIDKKIILTRRLQWTKIYRIWRTG
jgi:hypothetical protein